MSRMSRSMEFKIKGRIGGVLCERWKIDALLATGATTSVYSATDLQKGGRCALKVLHSTIRVDESTRRRFQREGYVANAVGHPGVVNVFDSGVTEDGAMFIVMELLDGCSLEDLRRRNGGTLPAAHVVDVARSALDILAATHARGVIHRDLKPANVFWTTQGQTKILDFGLACIWFPEKESSVTRPGIVLGTPAFMPPEQARGRRDEVDARSDIWAFGATLYTLLSGRPVHDIETAHAQLLAAMTKPAAPIRSVAPHVPPPLAAVIDRALSYEKAQRYEDADAMSKALAKVNVEPAPVSDTEPTPVASPRIDQAPTPVVVNQPGVSAGATATAAAGVTAGAAGGRPTATAAANSAGADSGTSAVRPLVLASPVDSLSPQQRSLTPRTRKLPPAAIGVIAAACSAAMMLGILVVSDRHHQKRLKDTPPTSAFGIVSPPAPVAIEPALPSEPLATAVATLPPPPHSAAPASSSSASARPKKPKPAAAAAAPAASATATGPVEIVAPPSTAEPPAAIPTPVPEPEAQP
jgi:serine/threonine-protein kinase